MKHEPENHLVFVETLVNLAFGQNVPKSKFKEDLWKSGNEARQQNGHCMAAGLPKPEREAPTFGLKHEAKKTEEFRHGVATQS